MIRNNLYKSLIYCVVLAILSSCSSVPMGELSSSANPGEEIARLSADLNRAQDENLDVLARREYMRSHDYLKKAERDHAKGRSQDSVIDSLRFGRHSLKRAYSLSEGRRDKVPGLFEARQRAIRNGASRSSKLSREWSSVEEDLAGRAAVFGQMSPEEIQEYQLRYADLEKKSLVDSLLSMAVAQVNGARKDGAEKRAPSSLRQAEISLRNAESLIASNINNPIGFNQAILRANSDSQFLADVIEIVNQTNPKVSEAAAIKIVVQRREIAQLRGDLSSAEVANSEVELQLDSKTRTLSGKEAALKAARASLAIQGAMEKSRNQFSSNEVESFRQGGNLVIRLKSINFKSGHAELPTQALPLLARVAAVARSLDATNLKIEGHTDSTGNQQSNKMLSEQRANAVATYFIANGFERANVTYEGHGINHPIGPNTSKEGRAQNRRVDIIIGPITKL